MARPETTPEQQRLLAVIGNALREHREAQDLTQAQLGHAMGRDDKYVSRVERGLVNISATRVIEFAHAFGEPPGALLDAAASVYATDHPREAE